jgi:hypothetical protein
LTDGYFADSYWGNSYFASGYFGSGGVITPLVTTLQPATYGTAPHFPLSYSQIQALIAYLKVKLNE